jgi:ABC-type tungstate transport system permease subunit
MALALRHADERQAYTLSDEATFWQFSSGITLASLFEDDARLLNTYAVIYLRHIDKARTFSEWLTRGDGRTLTDNYRIASRRAFSVWPLGCPDDSPSAEPCMTPGSDRP